MKHTILTLLIATPAYAGGMSEPRFDPEPIRPVCTTFFGLPCHVGFDYVNPEGDEPRQSVTVTDDEPEENESEQCE